MKHSISAFLFSLPVLGLAQSIALDTHLVVLPCNTDSLNFQFSLDSLTSTHHYTVQQLASFQPEDTGGTWLPGSASHYSEQDLDFPFYFYCERYTEIMPFHYARLNFTFGVQNGIPWTIPDAALNSPKNAISAAYKRWAPGAINTDSVFMQTIGTAPYRKCVVTYTNHPLMYCTSLRGKFQFVLHETTNIIDVHLFNIPSCVSIFNFSGYATMGIQNAAGTVATPVPGRNNSYWTAQNESWRFSPVGLHYWSNEQGDTLGTDSALTYVPTKSEWIYANALVCPDTLISDSAFIIMECYELSVNTVWPVCQGDSSGLAVATCTDTAFVGPYTWHWTDSLGETIAVHTTTVPTDTLSGVPAGYYFCRAYDSLLIAASGGGWVQEQDTGEALLVGLNLLCHADSSGQLVAADTQHYGANWAGSYTYHWFDSSGVLLLSTTVADSTDTLGALASGAYSVLIDGCQLKVGTVSIGQPALLTAAAIMGNQATCADACNGTATVSLGGGTPPYAVWWPSAEWGLSADSLCAGAQAVWVSDSHGCTAADSFTVLAPAPLITAVAGPALVCVQVAQPLVASAVGGMGPYNFTWLNETGATLATGGLYSPPLTHDTTLWVTATDQMGCAGDTVGHHVSVRPPLWVSLPAVDTLCPSDTVALVAQAAGGDSIYSYQWSDGSQGAALVRTFSQSQWLWLALTDQCGTPAAVDSLWVQVGGYQPITAIITADDDSLCAGESATLEAQAVGGFGPPAAFTYTWSHSEATGSVAAAHPTASVQITLSVGDLCLSKPGQAALDLWVDPAQPPTPEAEAGLWCSSSQVGVHVSNHSPGNTYRWTLNGAPDTVIHTTAQAAFYFEQAGCQSVSVVQLSAYGCLTTAHAPCLVDLKQRPTAAFNYTPEVITHRVHEVETADSSTGASAWRWFLNEEAVGEGSTSRIRLADTGHYELKLVVSNADGCSDTAAKVLHRFIAPSVYVPNAFTPAGDGLNDVFEIVAERIMAEGFQFTVFDRWGRVVFKTTDPHFKWNATDPSGKPVPSGSYGYELIYRDHEQQPVQRTGAVQVVGS